MKLPIISVVLSVVSLILVASVGIIQVDAGSVETKDGVTTYTRVIEDVNFDRSPVRVYLKDKSFYYVLCNPTWNAKQSSCNVTVETATEDGFKSKSCQVEFKSMSSEFKESKFDVVKFEALSDDVILMYADFLYGVTSTNFDVKVIHMSSCKSEQVSKTTGFNSTIRARDSVTFDLVYYDQIDRNASNFYREKYSIATGELTSSQPEFYKRVELTPLDPQYFQDTKERLLFDRQYNNTLVLRWTPGDVHLFKVEPSGKPSELLNGLGHYSEHDLDCDLLSVCWARNISLISCNRYDAQGALIFSANVTTGGATSEPGVVTRVAEVANDCRRNNSLQLVTFLEIPNSTTVRDLSYFVIDQEGRHSGKPVRHWKSASLVEIHEKDPSVPDNKIFNFNDGPDVRDYKVQTGGSILNDQLCLQFAEPINYFSSPGVVRKKLYFTLNCFSLKH